MPSTLPSTAFFASVGALVVASIAPDVGGARELAEENAPRANASAAAPEPVRYDRDIRPLLADRCFRCHGSAGDTRMGELRLDEFVGATADRGGYAAIVPGNARASELVARIALEDPGERMPPASSNKPALTAEQAELVRRWIDEGAHYEPHWSFTPPLAPAVPTVRDAAACRNELDRFVRSRLELEGVAPSPEIDRATLLRRVFLDLTGLPPTPDELDQFLADASPDAFEHWVDRIFSEEPYRTRYAERMASPWMDQARYADTCGIHMDAGRQMWLWRDWVLDAYRTNMPFDQFLTEQLAGDLMPDATEAQKIASGFNRNHVTTDEGGAISEEYLVEYAVDRTATTGAVFLGLTLGCARCHEHKFDPISQEDFFKVYSFFDSIEEPGLYSQLPDPTRAFEPYIEVPTPEIRTRLAELGANLEAQKAALVSTTPEEEVERAAFLANTARDAGVAWAASKVIATSASQGVQLALQADGSVLASGENPARDEHVLTLRTDATLLRLVALEALTDASLPHGRVGRAPNGNAVLNGIEIEARSVRDPKRTERVPLVWAWADHEQPNGDFKIVNTLKTDDQLGWAVNAHNVEGPRVALFLADASFGFEGGTELVVKLTYDSVYDQHTFGRVRLRVASLAPGALERLPLAVSGWYLAGPFTTARDEVFKTVHGPESITRLDLAQTFGPSKLGWSFDENLLDAKTNALPDGVAALYVARRVLAPSPRTLDVSLGSDDGFRLFVAGVEAASKETDRAVAADQDQAKVSFVAGESALVMKIVNTGGQAGFYHRAVPRAGELAGDLVAVLLPPEARWKALDERIDRAWRFSYSPQYKARVDAIAALETEVATTRARIPRTMVMKELAKPRDTYVLMRGEYDKPDKNRKVERGVPSAFGKLPDGAPQDRRGLAAWLTSPENPLVARVAVNRLWELVFGTGIVSTSEDFGLQGDYPSHPELLDWLAVDFRNHGWDVQRALKQIVTSATYRQSSRARPEVKERDPDNRWLSYSPRRRLSAEQIRDQALYVSGLLVEKSGGPSVKPYQPDGLWQEVAMPSSNTRIFERGVGDDLWRRSLYTYWKRACPPPSLMTLDAPTREFCTIRRSSTNTPLQALVLWNDEQFVEAARLLASRTLAENGTDRERLTRLFRRCTGRIPDESALVKLEATLASFRDRYTKSPEDAKKLLAVGVAMQDEHHDAAEVAAWMLVGSAVLNLDAAISRG